MPFWLHKPRYILVAAAQPEWIKRLAVVAIGGGVCCWLLDVVYLPVRAGRAQQQEELIDLQQQKGLFERVAAQYDQTKQKNTQLQADFEQQAQACKAPQAIGSFLEQMQRHGIACRGVQPQASKNKDFYEKQYITVESRGEFKQFLSFLDELRVSSPFLKFKAVHFDKGKRHFVKSKALVRVVHVKDA